MQDDDAVGSWDGSLAPYWPTRHLLTMDSTLELMSPLENSAHLSQFLVQCLYNPRVVPQPPRSFHHSAKLQTVPIQQAAFAKRSLNRSGLNPCNAFGDAHHHCMVTTGLVAEVGYSGNQTRDKFFFAQLSKVQSRK